MKKLILTFLFLIILAFPVSAINGIPGPPEGGTLKVEVIPRTVIVGEKVEILVTSILTNAPVPNAEVRVAKVVEVNDTVIQKLIEGKIGETIGYTDENGRLTYKFDDHGTYLVLAIKENYMPGHDTVTVKPLGKLKIEVANKDKWIYRCDLTKEELAKMSVRDVIARCGYVVLAVVKVTDENGNPIEGAKVYVNEKFMGTTNESGEVTVELKQGLNIITASKKGYISDVKAEVAVNKELIESKVKELIERAKRKVERARERIQEGLRILEIENPKVVTVGEEFEIKVTFKGEPVEDATVIISRRGITEVTGKTDDNGIFRVKLNEPGPYVIKVTKEGYRVGVSVVLVTKSIKEKRFGFIHILPVIEPGKPEVIGVGKAFIKEIRLKAKEEVRNVTVSVIRVTEIPVPKPPKVKVYGYVKIEVESEDNKTVEGTITFNVSKDWLNKHGIDKNQIVLMKYVDGKWIELKTRVIGEDKQYVYYEAETPSFSYYAIAAKEVTPTITPTVTPTESKQQTPTPEMTPTPTPEKTETPTPEQTPPKETPGFEIVIGLIGVIVSLMLRRKS